MKSFKRFIIVSTFAYSVYVASKRSTNLGLYSISQFIAKVLTVLLVLTSFTLQAGNTVTISEQNFNSLGITLGKLEKTKQVPLLTAPAKVVIPPSHEYLVTASQAGLITKLNMAVGDHVNKGEALAELNSPDLLSMQRLYLKAVNDMQLGSLELQRDKKLVDEGVVAKRRWQETQSQYNAFVSEVSEHSQLLAYSGMSDSEIERLKSSHRLSGLLTIPAPITGVVIERKAVAGERVDMLAPIYRVANLDELWLEMALPQERVANIHLGNRVLIENTEIDAVITLIGQSVNPENQTLLARALINDKNTGLRPGQRINVQIIQASTTVAFKVPDTAIAQNAGKAFIFVRDSNGFLVTPITVIGKQNNESIIEGKLTGDESIAVNGAVALKANWLGLGSGE